MLCGAADRLLTIIPIKASTLHLPLRQEFTHYILLDISAVDIDAALAFNLNHSIELTDIKSYVIMTITRLPAGEFM